ncbi:hypothetical protein GCM10009612_44480 [Streptomyces beijiangensis]
MQKAVARRGAQQAACGVRTELYAADIGGAEGDHPSIIVHPPRPRSVACAVRGDRFSRAERAGGGTMGGCVAKRKQR